SPVADAGPLADASGSAPVSGSLQCASYTPLPSIVAMRTPPGKPGCYAITGVVAARTSSQSVPRIFLQDSAGGDYSAIMAKCLTTAPHACSPTALPTALTLSAGESVTLKGDYHHGKITGFEEFSIEEIVDNGATLPVPAPITLPLADITAGAAVPPKWF